MTKSEPLTSRWYLVQWRYQWLMNRHEQQSKQKKTIPVQTLIAVNHLMTSAILVQIPRTLNPWTALSYCKCGVVQPGCLNVLNVQHLEGGA